MANPGDSVSAANFNNLFSRLNAVRTRHYNAGGLTSAQKTALGTAYSETVAVVGQNPVPANITALRDALTNLDNSPYIANTFAANITIPATGTLLFASTITTAETQVRNVEDLCPNCSFFTAAANQGHFSSNFTSAANKGHFSSNFTSASSKGFYSSNYGSSASRGDNSAYYTTAARFGDFT